MMKIRQEIQEINDNMDRNEELVRLRLEKNKLEKSNDAMQRQSNMLEKQINEITDHSIEVNRHAAAKKAEVNSLRVWL